MANFKVFTDGSCWNKTGEGGFGVVFTVNNKIIKEHSSSKFIKTTSTRMEMMAIIYAMSKIKKGVCFEIHSDSEYCVMTLNEWLDNWVEENIINHKKNYDLLKKFLYLRDIKHKGRVNFFHIKGHNGHVFNELADKLAGEARLSDGKEN